MSSYLSFDSTDYSGLGRELCNSLYPELDVNRFTDILAGNTNSLGRFINYRGDGGMTPLMLAARGNGKIVLYGHIQCAQALIEGKADPNIVNDVSERVLRRSPSAILLFNFINAIGGVYRINAGL